MGFRRTQNDADIRRRQWGEWIHAHVAELVAIGLPPEVYLDESRWDDFLQNGHLHWHRGSGWNFTDLQPNQMRHLGQFLEQHFGDDARCESLRGFIEVRISGDYDA